MRQTKKRMQIHIHQKKRDREAEKKWNKTLNGVFTFVYFVCKQSSVYFTWFFDWIPYGLCIAFAYCLWLWPSLSPSMCSIWASLQRKKKKFHFYSVYPNSGKRIKKNKKLSSLLSLSSVADSILYIFIFSSSSSSLSCLTTSHKPERIQWKYRFSYFFDFMCDSGLNIITHSKQYGYHFHTVYTRKKKWKWKRKN